MTRIKHNGRADPSLKDSPWVDCLLDLDDDVIELIFESESEEQGLIDIAMDLVEKIRRLENQYNVRQPVISELGRVREENNRLKELLSKEGKLYYSLFEES